MSSQKDALSVEEGAAPTPAAARRVRILGALWRFHPVIFLALSLGMAGIAWPLLPSSKGMEIAAVPLYAAGLAELRALLAWDEALPPAEARQRATNAWAAFDLLVRCCGDELADHPEFINPYLLLAEAARLDGRETTARRQTRLEQALMNYDAALQWEKRWQEPGVPVEVEAAYAYHNYVDDIFAPLPGDDRRDLRAERRRRAAEIAERQRRRLLYLRLQRAIVAAEIGRHGQAEEELLKLKQECAPPAASVALASGQALMLPRHFEVRPADLEAIPYHLGMIHAELGRLAEAQRELQSFLLSARRGEERFRAILRLAAIHLEAGRRGLASGEEMAEAEAMRHLQSAVILYRQMAAEGAPEPLVREAYFFGGSALLLLAETLEEGRPTWWDAMAEYGERLQGEIAYFTGKTLPARTRRLPQALATIFWSEETNLPSLAAPWRLPTAILLLGGEMGTRRQQRRLLIAEARTFFEAAAGGDRRFAAPSQMMMARTLLAEGQSEVARRLFRHTLATSEDSHIALACRHGEARAWLAEGRLDEAKARLVGGVEIRAAAELRAADIDWVPFLLRVYEESGGSQPTPGRRIWDFLGADERESTRRVSMTRRVEPPQRDLLLSALNALLRREDFYAAEYFTDLPLPAAARYWLERDRALWREDETMWLNRLLLETAFSREIASSPSPPIIHPPFPPAAEIGANAALTVEDISRDLTALFRAYQRRADALEREAQANREQAARFARLRRQQARALDDTVEVGRFLLANYPGRSGAVAMEVGETCERLARVIYGEPFRRRERSEVLIALAAGIYLAAGGDAHYEEEALLRAGYGFYAAGRLERTVEVLRRYLERYRSSDRAGAAQNLLGRALWNLGQLVEAAKVYRDNADRRTPEGHKSLYYLGAVFLEMEQSRGEDGSTIDRLGDPAAPLPRMEEKGPRIETALQAFEYLRRMPEISPDSRPWRWATFGLGHLKYRMAERARRAAPQKPEAWLTHFRAAADALQEGLERYPLSDSGAGVGIDRELEPEDYWETMRARFAAQYALARVYEVLQEEKAARAHFADLLDETLYPPAMFEGETGRSSWLRPMLGVIEGPSWSTEQMLLLRRNAYFHLGRLWLHEGERCERKAAAFADEGKEAESETERQKARQAHEEASRIYQAAYDRLPLSDSVRALYGQAECLRRLGKKEEAAAKYALARSAARHRLEGEQADIPNLGADFWENLAAERQKDLEEGYDQ